MLPRRTLVTVVLALLALVGGAGVASGAPVSDAAQTDGVNVTTFVAPGDAVGRIRAGSAEDVLTRRPRVALGDTLVVRVAAPGLGGAVADQPGNTTTDRFRGLLSSADASLRGVEITSRETPRALALTADQLVVRRTGEDAFDLIYDTDRLRATDDENGNGRADDGTPTALSPVSVFSIQFSFRGSSGDSSMGVFPVSMRFSTASTDEVVLYPLPAQRVVGRTPLAPGTEVTLALTAENGAVDVERRVRVTGDRQSFANLSLDLTGVEVEEDVPLTITARHDGRRLRRATGRLGALTASFTPDTAGTSRERLSLRNVSFATGGFLLVRDGREGSLIANRYVEAGTHDALTVQYRQAATADSVTVTAYVDVDGDRILERSGPDRPFGSEGESATTVVDLADPDPGTDADTTAAPRTDTPATPSATPPTSPVTDRTGPETATPYGVTDASGDGFGVGLALVALGALAALVGRD